MATARSQDTGEDIGDQELGADQIRAAGLRVTNSRQAVFEALRRRSHARAEDVYECVRETVPQTSLQSVYNALGDFSRVGLVRRIEPAGHPGLYELRTGDNHHHAICTKCGAISDIDCVAGDPPCLQPVDDQDFEVAIAEITFWGLCRECA